MAARCGISYTEFWGMTPKALLIYKEEKDREEREKARMADISAWMIGIYVGKAIGCALDSKAQYPSKNFIFTEELEMTEEEIEKVVEENTQIASVNFAAYAKAFNEARGR